MDIRGILTEMNTHAVQDPHSYVPQQQGFSGILFYRAIENIFYLNFLLISELPS